MRISDWSSDVCSSDLDLLVGEFHHLARLHVDEVVVMLFRPLLIARPAIAEVVPLQDARLLEELHRAVHGGNGDPGIALDGTLIDELDVRSEEHTSELQSLMRISYAVFCLKKKKQTNQTDFITTNS